MLLGESLGTTGLRQSSFPRTVGYGPCSPHTMQNHSPELTLTK